MESGLLTVIICMLVILSTCYTNGLTLNDLYPYGTEHGDAMRNGSGFLQGPLLPPIDNLVRFGPAEKTASRYRVLYSGLLSILNNALDGISLHLLYHSSGDFSNTKIYGRTTDEPVLIRRAMDQINEGFPNTFCSASPPTQLIIGTWIDHLKAGTNPGSNFQLIVITNGSNTFGIALYVNVRVTSADTTGIESSINSNQVPADPSFFPFGTTVANAPSMMLNSNIPGTYIFSLNHIPPDPCTEPDCSAVCKAKLLKMACEIRRINGETLPAPCNN